MKFSSFALLGMTVAGASALSLQMTSTLEPPTKTVSRTQRIMESTAGQQTGGAGGTSSYQGFLRAEENWTRLKQSKSFSYDSKILSSSEDSPPRFVTDDGATGNPACWAKLRKQDGIELDYEVAICGGTLGIFFATALALKGHKVVVLEAGKLQGREQEWNISMDEMEELFSTGWPQAGHRESASKMKAALKL